MLLLKLTSSLQGCPGRGPAAPPSQAAQDPQLESKERKTSFNGHPRMRVEKNPFFLGFHLISPTGPLHAANLLFPEKIAVWLGVEVGFREGPREAVTKLPLILSSEQQSCLPGAVLSTHPFPLRCIVSLSVTRLFSGHRLSCGSWSRGKKRRMH